MDALDPDEARKLFQVMKNERDLEETEPITILQWWSKKHNHVWVGGDFDGPPKEMTRLPTSCGGCYWTNDRHEEKTANALLIDNMYYLGRNYWKGSTKPKYKANVPNVGFIIIFLKIIIVNKAKPFRPNFSRPKVYYHIFI